MIIYVMFEQYKKINVKADKMGGSKRRFKDCFGLLSKNNQRAEKRKERFMSHLTRGRKFAFKIESYPGF